MIVPDWTVVQTRRRPISDDKHETNDSQSRKAMDNGALQMEERLFLIAFKRVAPLIRWESRRNHVPKSEVDDILQASFAEGWASECELVNEEMTTAWIMRLARREIRRWRRQNAKTTYLYNRSTTALATTSSDAPEPLPGLVRAESVERIRIALLGIDEQSRDLLLQRFEQGNSIKTIAAKTGVLPHTTKLRIYRAIVALKRRIKSMPSGENLAD